MKVIIATNKTFGPPEVLEFIESQTAKLKANEFLVKGEYATASTADIRLRSKNVPRGFKFIMSIMFGFQKPKYECLGTDYSGTVVALGEVVTDLKIGDRVVVDLGMGLNGYRTYRSFKSKDVWAKLPEKVSTDNAVAAIFGGLTAKLFLWDKLNVRQQDRVLIIGAGGAVGSSAVQLAKFYGADVTAVCSASKADVVKELGASHVVDYQTEGWENKIQQFDIILDCVGVFTLKMARKHLKPHGRIGFVVADMMLNLECVWSSIFSKQKFVAGAIQSTKKDLQFLLELIEQEKLKPLIGKRFSFKDIVAAHREVESGHRLGATLIEFE